MGKQTRREFLKAAGFATASAEAFSLLPGCAGISQKTEVKRKRPNIIFFFADDQRFDTIRSLGNKHIITPNIDSLVHNGTTFTNAYIMGSMSGAVCVPSRAMLMTGRTLFHLEGTGKVIPQKHVTLPEALRKAGYTTFHTGKWHQDSKTFARSFTAGDKIFFGGMNDHYKVPIHNFDPTGKYPKEKIYREEGKHSSELFSEAAIQFLHDYKSDKPFFIYVAYTAPHDPRHMPKKYLDMYDPEKIGLPKNFLPEHPFDNGELDVRDERLAPWPRTPKEIRKHIAAYYAMITHMDAQIGRVLTTIKEMGQAENTIIIFAGDNGLAVGRHGLMGKQNLYEHSVHVPLIFSGPGIPKGKKRNALCYLLDIYPALCDLTRVPIPNSVEGKSLTPIIRGQKRKIRESLFFAYKNFQRSVRTDRWKLILYNVNGKKTSQLFDLQNDPWELTNLSDDPGQAKRIQELTAVMKEWFRKTGDKVNLEEPNWAVPLIPSWKSREKKK